ncbi:tetratricopeptide repeat protein [Kitasatospora sp. McL0602]|uniref:AfsR/SARP family transcriptional regulator n=1 Tax=Kitasatospora sp. McL0602 TaxID=3439530 RepID=UPI003F89677C
MLLDQRGFECVRGVGEDTGVEFQLLGAVQVRTEGTPVDLGWAKQRCLLAILLMRRGRAVSVEDLIDRLWGDQPPLRGRDQLYTYVSRLREVLRADDSVELTRCPAGYALRVDPTLVDVHRFRTLTERARAASGPAERAELLREALGQFSGEPLAGVPGDWAERTRTALNGQRLGALTDRIEADLALGAHHAVLDELAALQPGDERLVGQWILALYRSGRLAEALVVYEQTRRRLAEDLGADPGQALQELHQQILRNDPQLDLTAPPQGVRRPTGRSFLPYDVPDFTGRASELDRLLGAIGGNAGSVVISAIDGMAGVGKTALAVHAAHRLADRYPDGQLFVDLHGFTPGRDPVTPAGALDGLLRALGVPPGQIPEDLGQRAGLWRAELAGRRALVLLDNAADAAQVRPLLPGSSGCLALVTSRRRLSTLDGAMSVSLDVLGLAEAAALFTRVVGAERCEAVPQVVAEVVALCGHLPLAIRIAAARLVHRPTWAAAHLADRLREEAHRLTELTTDDQSVAAAFNLSYHGLIPAQQRLFRLLGLNPGNDADPYAAAALAGLTLRQADDILEELVDHHLLEQSTPGRYAFHDLIRRHAKATVLAEESEEEQHTALTRLFDHYLHTASVATALLHPAEQARHSRAPAPTTPRVDLAGVADAQAWLGAEHANLLACAEHAAAGSWPAYVTGLSTVLWGHLDTQARFGDAEKLHQLAVLAAQRLSAHAAPAAHAHALVNLGIVFLRTARYQQGVTCQQEALALIRELPDRPYEGDALGNLGIGYWCSGAYTEAADHYEKALAVFRRIGDRTGESRVLSNLGFVHERTGHYEQAADLHRQALAIFRELSDHVGEGGTLHGLGIIYRRTGQYEQAADHHRRALAIFRETGHLLGEGEALHGLGVVHCRTGSHERAIDHHHQALAVFRRIGYRLGEVEATNGLGESHRSAGRPQRAVERHQAALTLATGLGDTNEEARAHRGLADAYHDLDRTDDARRHRQHALKLYTELGAPEAQEVVTWACSSRVTARTP